MYLSSEDYKRSHEECAKIFNQQVEAIRVFRSRLSVFASSVLIIIALVFLFYHPGVSFAFFLCSILPIFFNYVLLFHDSRDGLGAKVDSYILDDENNPYENGSEEEFLLRLCLSSSTLGGLFDDSPSAILARHSSDMMLFSSMHMSELTDEECEKIYGHARWKVIDSFEKALRVHILDPGN